MIHKVLLSGIAALLCCNAFSQSYDNNWVFGDSAGLNFSSGEPEPFVSSIWTYEACASISDSSGNLLFYTNGDRVWNNSHELMPNGDDLHIAQPFPHFGSSLTQGVIIIPFVNQSGKFYIFQIQHNSGTIEYGLEYSIVDMNLDGGLGDISTKNAPLFIGNIGEKMAATKHGNGNDWWLIVRKRTAISEDLDDLIFVSFLITHEGIEGPFYQDFGPDSYPGDPDYETGQMGFSRDGGKLVYSREDGIIIFDFNRCDGSFTDYYSISDISSYIYGCAFSPDGTKIYVNSHCSEDLFQYCINCDGIPIDSTKKLVYQASGSYCLGQLQLGPDGKIYIPTSYSLFPPGDIFTAKNQNLNVINYPDELFPYCDFDTNTVSLGSRRTTLGLPNMVNYNLGPLVGSGCDTLGTSVQNMEAAPAINVYPNPAEEQIIIDMGADPTGTSFLILTNTMGQMVCTTALNKRKTQMDISPLPEGIYAWSVIISGEHIAAGQVLKLKP